MTYPKIITFTGASGVGKTTLAKKLLEKNNFQLVTSTTTREARPSDSPREYEHISFYSFAELNEQNSFIWTAEHGGNHYGTKFKYIHNALNAPYTSIMILVPEVLPKLIDYAKEQILPFYIRSPGDEELKRRLIKREEPLESIEKRLKQSEDWEREAEDSKIPYRFIHNPFLRIEDAVREVRLYLNVNKLK
ncbi:MAG: AAA family ATPase [Nanoarchaeota archaeon]|nr:AAA family ATPase [Nanoarchaeota archaeon]